MNLIETRLIDGCTSKDAINRVSISASVDYKLPSPSPSNSLFDIHYSFSVIPGSLLVVCRPAQHS